MAVDRLTASAAETAITPSLVEPCPDTCSIWLIMELRCAVSPIFASTARPVVALETACTLASTLGAPVGSCSSSALVASLPPEVDERALASVSETPLADSVTSPPALMLVEVVARTLSLMTFTASAAPTSVRSAWDVDVVPVATVEVWNALISTLPLAFTPPASAPMAAVVVLLMMATAATGVMAMPPAAPCSASVMAT